MAIEYKLSYTATEIDNKLGKIDSAVLITEQTLSDEQKARVRENIDAIGAPQTAEVGQFIKVTEVDENGKPIAWEAGDPDWERMENKPFEDLPTGGDTLTWDGNTEGLEVCNERMYRVSDVVPSLDDLKKGITVSLMAPGGTIRSIEVPESDVVERFDGFYSVRNVVYVITETAAVTKGTPSGTYFMYGSNISMSTISLTIPGYTGFPMTKKIEEKFIPDLPATVPNILTANVGQMILVKAVDENNVPTEWEVADRTHYTYMAPAVMYRSENLTPNVRVDVEKFNYKSTAKVNIYSPGGILLYSKEFEYQTKSLRVPGVGCVFVSYWYGNGSLGGVLSDIVTEVTYVDEPILVCARGEEYIDGYYVYLDDSSLPETYDSYIVEVLDTLNTAETYSPLDEAYIPSAIARVEDVNAGLAEKVTAPQSATVGQVIAVKAVDENGVPKEWECVDLPEGLSGSWNDLEDKPFGKETTISQIIEPTDLTFKTKYTGGDHGECYTESLTFDGTAWMDQFKKGDIAVVVVDGVKYTAVVEPFKRWMRACVQDEDGDLLYELRFPVTDVQDTIIISPYCFQTVGEHTVNFSLRKESTVITPISEEYLPSAVILGIDSENYLISIETGERITTAQLRAMYEAGTTVYVQFEMWHMAVLSYVFISGYAYVTCGKVSGTTMEFVNYYTAEYTA